MAYVKTVWETGDVITAAKLNNAEDGIEALQPLLLDVDEWTDETATHAEYVYYYTGAISGVSYSDVNTALASGRIVVASIPETLTIDPDFGKGPQSVLLTSLFYISEGSVTSDGTLPCDVLGDDLEDTFTFYFYKRK